MNELPSEKVMPRVKEYEMVWRKGARDREGRGLVMEKDDSNRLGNRVLRARKKWLAPF